ncbi:protein kinase C delta type-like isoform X2 [Dendropsophus ebraccatus]
MVKKRPLLKYAAVKRAMDEKRVLELAGGSPFLTASYATFQTVDYLCYVMEYLRGGDLFDFLNTRAPLDEDTIRFLTAEIICGLQYLHTMGVIHRDISPENIFLDSTGHIKIGDYGLCATDVSAENKASGCVGAQNYMAPEVFNQDSYDSSVDWFSLGVLMYKMTTGTMKSVNQDRQTYPEGCSEYLVDIIEKLLRTNAEKRLEFATTIRNHPFFADIDWAKLMAKEVAPPFSMASAPLMDPVFYVPVQHIISQREAKKPAIPPEGQKMFWGFSSSSHTWKMLQRQAGSQVLSPRDIRVLLVTVSP